MAAIRYARSPDAGIGQIAQRLKGRLVLGLAGQGDDDTTLLALQITDGDLLRPQGDANVFHQVGHALLAHGGNIDFQQEV